MTLKIFQIVGYKNSGKTTAMCHLIEALQSRGYKVASLKHHAHFDSDDRSDHGTDTGKHRGSGAVATILSGPESAQMTFSTEPPIEAYIDFYHHLDIDVLLIEGFKNGPYPKAVLLRSEEDFQKLKNLENIQAIIVPKRVSFHEATVPFFYREDVETYTSYIKKWLEGQL